MIDKDKSMSKQIFIDEKFLMMIPRPTDDQKAILKHSIATEGLKNPIIINKKGKIIDGHTRYEICQSLSIEPRYEIREFRDEQDELDYVLTSNVKRRHLTQLQIYELFENKVNLLRDETQKIKAEKISQSRLGIKSPDLRDWQKRKMEQTYYKISQMSGLSASSIQKIHSIKTNNNKKTIAQLHSGGISLQRAYDISRSKHDAHKLKNKEYRTALGVVIDIIFDMQTVQNATCFGVLKRIGIPSGKKHIFKMLLDNGFIDPLDGIRRGSGNKNREMINGREYQIGNKGYDLIKKCAELKEFIGLNDSNK